jgi:hypothetical protein
LVQWVEVIMMPFHSPEARAKQKAHRQTIEWKRSAMIWLHTEEADAKRSAVFNDPGFKAKKAASQRAAFAKPEVKAKLLAARARQETPETTARRIAGVKANWEARRTKYGSSGRSRSALRGGGTSGRP